MAWIPNDIQQYCVHHSTRPSDLCRELETYTRAKVLGSNMLVGEMEASVLSFVIALGKVKHILEFGTFTGYSALAMAEQLPSDGTVDTLDINPDTTAVAQSFWDRSPHGKKITAHLGPALDNLKNLSNKKFDLVFIDADKSNYPNYLAWGLEHLSEHGVIIADNSLWSGKVLEEKMDNQTAAIHQNNTLISKLDAFTKTLLPIRDGMFMLTRKP